MTAELTLKLPVVEWVKDDPKLNDDEMLKRILDAADAAYEEKVARVDLAAWRGFERNVMLQSLDTHWREHLAALDHLRQGIHLRGYAQKNPKQEYKREAFQLFTSMLDRINYDAVSLLARMQVRSEAELEREELERQAPSPSQPGSPPTRCCPQIRPRGFPPHVKGAAP